MSYVKNSALTIRVPIKMCPVVLSPRSCTMTNRPCPTEPSSVIDGATNLPILQYLYLMGFGTIH